VYTNKRLEWHLGDEKVKEEINPAEFCVVLSNSKRVDFSSLTNRLAVALAKSQDHRAFCGVFAFGQHNAVRQWLCLRYPITRQTKVGNVGELLERGG
jgi:hypothetical protein